MIDRSIQRIVESRLRQFPAVALLGPRQVGKTTLAQAIGAGRSSVYLDLEAPADRVANAVEGCSQVSSAVHQDR